MHEPIITWLTRVPFIDRTVTMLPGEWGAAASGSIFERSTLKTSS